MTYSTDETIVALVAVLADMDCAADRAIIQAEIDEILAAI